MAAMNDILLACTIGDIGWLKRGLERGISPNSMTKQGLKCLHLAAKHGMFDCVKYLLENNINGVNDLVPSTGDTALHTVLGSSLGKMTVKFVRLLLDNGGDLDRENKIGQVPLHIAARFGHIKSLKFLLNLGVDISKTDGSGSTAYDLACLHGKHECARLLKALHWANKKDTDLDVMLKKEHLRKKQEKEYLALHTRLRMEAADNAFEEWLEQKEATRLSTVTPSACEERKQVRSRTSQKGFSCATCTATTSKLQSAVSRKISSKVNSQIKVNPRQEPHNVDSVGKPRKLYPYSNYPPKHLRCSSAGDSKLKHGSKSGRSSRAATVHSELIIVQKKSKSIPNEKATKMQNSATKEANTAPNKHFKSNDYSQASAEDDYLDEDEDLLFHDVGLANNLETLALPNKIKHKTQNEVIQLLQSLGESSSKNLNRSRSVSLRRSSVQSITHQRRLSLGAIPEGKMVTSYSDEEQSTAPSQIIDDSFIEELIKSLSSQEPEGSTKSPRSRIVWDEEDADSLVENDIPLIEMSAIEEQQSRRSSLTLSLSDFGPQSRGNSSSSNEHTLKVVNMEWDPVSGSVQSVITPSPLTPPPDLHQRKCLSPRTSPIFRTVSPTTGSL